MSADEAASLIQNGQQIAFSGFTPAGATKEIPGAIARRAEAEHAAGRPFKINIITARPRATRATAFSRARTQSTTAPPTSRMPTSGAGQTKTSLNIPTSTCR